MARPSSTRNKRKAFDDIDLSYAAGFFDMNGIVITTIKPITQTSDSPAIHHLQELFGGELIPLSGYKTKQVAWRLDEEELIQLFEKIGPFLFRHRAKAHRFLMGNGREPDFEPDF